MTSEVWQPLPARLAGRGGGLREGVPAALRAPLRDWIHTQALGYDSLVERVRRRLGLVQADGDARPAAHWLAYATRDRDLIVIADAVLGLPPRVSVSGSGVLARAEAAARAASLQQLLDDVRSVYTVREDGAGLERRAGARATKAYEVAVREAAVKPDAGSAAVHLREAWTAAHALAPDPARAYSEAVKAVESAAHAVLEPNNARATLGTMIGQVRSNPQAFRIALEGRSGPGDVGGVTAMLALLWDGQTSRHGSREQTRPETLDQARMAVYLAVTLVEWFASGAVGRA